MDVDLPEGFAVETDPKLLDMHLYTLYSGKVKTQKLVENRFACV
jgi:hypothetical protein